MTDPSRLVELAVKYAWAHLGEPYRWAGDDPIQGFDCSGLVIEVLIAAGLLPHRYDTTAEGLHEKWEANTVPAAQAGCLVFWTNSLGRISHVEMAIDEGHTIGASGGGASTTDEEAAAQQNAFVKVRPIGYRGANYKIVDPFARRIPMSFKLKAKAVAADVISIIAAALGFLPGLFKKKAYTLWYWPAKDPWDEKGTFSKRQCLKVQTELERLGCNPNWFSILRKGVKPPPGGPKAFPGGRK